MEKPEDKLSTLCALLSERMALVQARTEVILRAQAEFLAVISKQEAGLIYQDLEEQCHARTQELFAEIGAEFEGLRRREKKARGGENPQ
jgi:hypothetical protein